VALAGLETEKSPVKGSTIEGVMSETSRLSTPQNPVYLDHAATTPMLAEAIDALLPWLRDEFGNPSGVHSVSRRARQGLEEARDSFAATIGAKAREIVFTGGGTEAINLALTGVLSDPTDMIAWSGIEHDAVRSLMEALSKAGRGESLELTVDADGVLDLGAAETSLRAAGGRVRAVCVMAVNNEVGTVQPIGELRALMNRIVPKAVLVVDAVQALSWMDVAPIVAAADLVAFSAHKFGGPKGVGALMVREGTQIAPLIHGGGQERERRSGTQNVAGIVSMALAAKLCAERRDIARVGALRDRLVDGLLTIEGCTETSPRSVKVAGNAHVCIEGVVSEELLVVLDQLGVCASAGSACASGALHLSPVLMAMGVPISRSAGALRLTLGATTTEADIDAALVAIPQAVARLRS
jgi:cysteine desulfurase